MLDGPGKTFFVLMGAAIFIFVERLETFSFATGSCIVGLIATVPLSYRSA